MADGHDQSGADVHDHPVGVTQLRAQLHRQPIQLRDGFRELLIQLLDAARQGVQGHLGGGQRGGDSPERRPPQLSTRSFFLSRCSRSRRAAGAVTTMACS